MKVKKLQLKNGLKVLLIQSHKSPVVAVQMWVRTGSADEGRGEEGISHFIEHLVFKGTEKFGLGEIAATVEGSGGELNAYTSFDQTVFYVTISKSYANTGLEVISEMMGFPKFDSGEIDNEREVVIEEIKRGQDSPGRQIGQLFFKTAYKKHPYGIPVIGFDKNIRKVSRKTLVNYFQSRYIPKNMFLVVSGDFEAKEMLNDIKNHFGRFEPFKLRRVVRKKEPAQTTPRLAVAPSTFHENFLYFGFKLPGAKHKDIPALDLLALILGQGDSSRLVHKLRIEHPVANSVGCSTFTPSDSGLFLFSATFKMENLEALLDGFKQELLRLFVDGISAEELFKAKVNFESDQFYSLETVDSLARRFGGLEFLYEDPNYFKKYLKIVSGLNSSDLIKAAKTWFNPKTLVIAGLSKENKALEKQLKAWIKTLSKDLEKVRAHKLAPPRSQAKIKKPQWNLVGLKRSPSVVTKKIVLDSGITLLLRKTSETPVISVRAAFLGGLRAEGPSEKSVTELFSRVWVSGTEKMTEPELYAYLEARAGSVSAFGGRNSFGLTMDCLAPFEKEIGEVFYEALCHSSFDSQILEREKIIMKNQIKSRNDNPAQLALLSLQSSLFGDHPYAKDMWGDEASVDSVSRESLMNYWKRLGCTKNLTLSVTGHFHEDYWIELAQRISKVLAPGQVFSSLFAHHFTESKTVKIPLKREQNHIAIAFKGLTLTDEERFTLEIIQAILAGQGGRLFVELRDKNSLAYSVSPIRMEGIDTGYFGAYIGCSPEKTETALQMLGEEFKRLSKELVPQEELDRAKRYIIGRHDIDLQRTSAITAVILFDEIYGLGHDATFKSHDKYLAVTDRMILDLSRKIFSQPQAVSIVGQV